MNWKSFIESLEEELNELENLIEDFLLDLTIEYNKPNLWDTGFGVITLGDNYYLSKCTIEQEKNQIVLLEKYKIFLFKLDRLVENIPNQIQERYKDIKQKFEKWINIEDISLLDNKINIPNFKQDVNDLIFLLKLFNNKEKKVILIPDTNALFIEPEPNEYKKLIEMDTFTFLLLPTVISELDDIKDKSTESSRKEKSKKMIKRIKGWKAQGKITQGVTLNKTITLKVEVGEPLKNNLPDWLDLSINDDKILTYILNIQVRLPSAIIILVTNDLNLQNKAETLNIDYLNIDLKEQK